MKDTTGKKFNLSQNTNGPDNVASIHHYKFKSREEFILKRSRGRGFHGTKQLDELVAMAVKGLASDGEPIPNGTVFDDLLWKTLKRMVPKYAVFDLL